jgi:hypothetical protein
MNRRGAAWLLALALLAAGTECAHWLTYRLVYPDPYTRATVLAASGHGYLSNWPAAAALGGALVIVALAARVFGRPGRADSPISLGSLLAIAPLSFALQESIETISAGHSPFLAVYAPTFLPGVLLAAPFGLAAALLARLLLRGADRLHTLYWRRRATRASSAAPRMRPGVAVASNAQLLLAGGLVVRGPPPLLRRA